MDIQRPASVAQAKKRRQIMLGVVAVVVIGLVSVVLARLRPAAPTVERATVWVDTVKRGPMIRQVRGLGTLVPVDEARRWVPASTQGRVERIVLRPGAQVTPDTVVLELSDPQVQQAMQDAEQQLRAAEADYNSLKARLDAETRLGAVEATALLRTVMEQIDVAVFAFDPQHRLRLVNRTGERLLGKGMDHMLGRTAEELSLTGWFGDAPRIVDIAPPGSGPGRWEVRRTTFRLGGLPHDLLVLSDVSRPLREQERQAWQRLIRVIGRELGNSLGPIKSIAGSLENLLNRQPPPEDWREDMQRAGCG